MRYADATRDPFDEILRSLEDDRVLPGLAYRDPDVFEAEVAEIFRVGWISVACGQNVPGPGDLFPVRIAGLSLLVVRDESGGVRVHYNLCRHRGARLVDEPCHARGGRVVCPYHAWSYTLDGKLASAPHYDRSGANRQPDPDERASRSLISLRSAVWRDVVFVDVSGEAQPFEDFIQPLEQRISRWTAAELRPLSSDEYVIEANWKLAAENFLDAYHLPVVHPQLGGGFSGALLAEDVEVSDHILGVVMPEGYGEGSGQAESPMPRFPGLGAEDQLRIEVFSVFPNTLLLVEPEFQQVIVLRPQGPGITEETFANYVVSDASQVDELKDYRGETHQIAKEVNDQDAVLLAGLQQARSMEVGRETQLCQAWDRTQRRFQRLWARKLVAKP